MKFNAASQFILTLVLVACVVWLGCSFTFYTEAIASPYFAFTLGGVLIIHFRIRPAWLDVLLVFLGALVLAFADFQILHYKRTPSCWVAFAGLASMAILGTHAIWTRGENRKLYLLAFIPAVCFVASEYFASNLLEWTGKLHPKVLDLYLYSFDASLYVQLPFRIGQAFSRWPALRGASLLFYAALSIPIALIYAGKVLRFRERAFPCFLAFVAAGPIGVFFYNLFPAVGPVHLFLQDFPWRPLALEQVPHLLLEPVPVAGYRNAIPSLHMAWVLLAWWYSRGMAWWERGVALVFLVFTVLATMGSGEHYAVDLVLAFPYALLIEALFSFSLPWKDKTRATAAAFGLASILLWFGALFYVPHLFWRSPILPWGMSILTILVSVHFERLLQTGMHHEVTGEKAAPDAVLAQS
jgi:hypothetical protein